MKTDPYTQPQNKVYAGVPGEGEGVLNDSRGSKTAIFGAFAGYVFGTFRLRDKANIII